MNHANDIERIAAASGRSPLDVLELFLERASIREYCGGQNRADAERGALTDVRGWFGVTP